MDLDSVNGTTVDVPSQGGDVEAEFGEVFDILQTGASRDRNEGEMR